MIHRGDSTLIQHKNFQLSDMTQSNSVRVSGGFRLNQHTPFLVTLCFCDDDPAKLLRGFAHHWARDFPRMVHCPVYRYYMVVIWLMMADNGKYIYIHMCIYIYMVGG